MFNIGFAILGLRLEMVIAGITTAVRTIVKMDIWTVISSGDDTFIIELKGPLNR
ncbi:MAG: hypothetical protein HRU05_04150 [Oceanospirillaceae bacterium]|nr:hypothetical protein [Oceanospirillaceae bacterium]